MMCIMYDVYCYYMTLYVRAILLLLFILASYVITSVYSTSKHMYKFHSFLYAVLCRQLPHGQAGGRAVYRGKVLADRVRYTCNCLYIAYIYIVYYIMYRIQCVSFIR